MEINELIRVVQEGEGLHAEFKSSLPKNATDIAKVMASFANTAGGTILVGVTDDGHIEGVAEPDEVMQRLANIAQASCRPPLSPMMGRFPVGSNAYLVWAKVEHQSDTLILVEGKIYTRVGPTSITVTDSTEFVRLLRIGPRSQEWASRFSQSSSSVLPVSKGFTGRATELKRLTTFIADPAVTVAVIGGISGIGKTALAAHFAANSHGESDYKSFWLDCRRETTFDALTSRLATFARGQGDELLADVLDDVGGSFDDRILRIAASLSEAKYLLILDDYHLLSDTKVDTLLVAIEERALLLKVVLTARSRPRVLARLCTLGVVELQLHTGIDKNSTSGFLRVCGLEVDENTAVDVWKRCGRGHPKALQILAARARSMPVKRVLSGLPAFRMDFRDVWLMPLLLELQPDEKNILLDLSVFDRPLLANALEILYPEGSTDTVMVALLDKFMLEYTHRDELEMRPLIREFCYDLLADKQAKHVWAAVYYRAQLPELLESDTLTDFQIEYAFAAWTHFTLAKDYAQAVEVVNAVRASLMNRGHLDQVMYLLDHTPREDATTVAWFDITRARILSTWGAVDDAVALVEPLTEVADQVMAREAMLTLMLIYVEHDMKTEASRSIDTYWPKFQGPVSPRTKRRFLSRVVQVHQLQGDSKHALEYSARICRACEAEGDEIGGGIALRQMATAVRLQGDLEGALTFAVASVDLLDTHGRDREAAYSRVLLGGIYAEMGDREEAEKCYVRALEVFEVAGDRKNRLLCRQRIRDLGSRDGTAMRERYPISLDA